MTPLTQTVSRLVRGWWQAEQIRISPCEGRLLRLQTPSYVRIGTQTLELIKRRTDHKSLGVIYDCSDGSELRVQLISLNQSLAVYWWRTGVEVELNELDVEIFNGTSD